MICMSYCEIFVIPRKYAGGPGLFQLPKRREVAAHGNGKLGKLQLARFRQGAARFSPSRSLDYSDYVRWQHFQPFICTILLVCFKTMEPDQINGLAKLILYAWLITVWSMTRHLVSYL